MQAQLVGGGAKRKSFGSRLAIPVSLITRCVVRGRVPFPSKEHFPATSQSSQLEKNFFNLLAAGIGKIPVGTDAHKPAFFQDTQGSSVVGSGTCIDRAGLYEQEKR